MPAIVQNIYTRLNDEITILGIDSKAIGSIELKIDTKFANKIEAFHWTFNSRTNQVTTMHNGRRMALQRYIAYIANGNQDTGTVTLRDPLDFRVANMIARSIGIKV